MNQDQLSRLMERLDRRYAGKYVGVVHGRVISSGRDQLKVFKDAEKKALKDDVIGIFYIPSKTANPLLLKLK